MGWGQRVALRAHEVGARAGSLPSRDKPRGRQLQFNPRAPLIPISMVSAHDARLGRGRCLVLSGFVSFSSSLLLFVTKKKGGNVADS